MSLLDWAKREVELACKREKPDLEEGEWDYGCACYKSALEAYEVLINQNHSGYSFGVTKDILCRLLDHIPLTPIEDREEDWIKDESRGFVDKKYTAYQHVRRGSLWKHVYSDGRIEFHDNDRACSANFNHYPNTLWFSGLTTDIVHEMYPIHFPYMPQMKPYILYESEYLTDSKNGDFDTIEMVEIKTPEGDIVPVDRFFKESKEGWKEINRAEFLERRNMHYKRINNEEANEAK